MAKICQICEEKISFMEEHYETQDLLMHRKCIKTFVNDPKKYGGVPENLTSIEKRYLTAPAKNKTSSKEEIPMENVPVERGLNKEEKRRLELREKSKGMVLTDIDLPFGRVFWVTVQFFVAGLILAIPIWIIFILIISN